MSTGTSVKLQLVTGTSHKFDFRGEKFIGVEQGDNHKTLFEIDEATPEQIEAVEQHGAELNELLGKMNFQGSFIRVGLFSGKEQ